MQAQFRSNPVPSGLLHNGVDVRRTHTRAAAQQAGKATVRLFRQIQQRTSRTRIWPDGAAG